jgi:hypothetical protein
MTLNTATFAPMPMASVSTAIKVKPLCLRSIRIPNRTAVCKCVRPPWERDGFFRRFGGSSIRALPGNRNLAKEAWSRQCLGGRGTTKATPKPSHSEVAPI